jgi:photosystem II stability/assembly factor-like uncharacterized protein
VLLLLLLVVFPLTAAGEWRPVKIGGGGYLTGMDLSPDGRTRCVRTDTYGAYCWDDAQARWTQIVTARSLPASDVAPGIGEGVYELRIAPSQPTRLYMAVDGYVFRSDDRGASWRRTAFARVAMDGNDAFRTSGEKMAVDPLNPDVVVLGTQQNGLWRTSDGGQSWARDASVPTTARITGIAFAPGAAERGRTMTIYAASAVGGVFRSQDGGARWSALPGGPSTGVSHAATRGGAYTAVSSAGKLWRYANGSWQERTPPAAKDQRLHALALDPLVPGRIVVTSDSAQTHLSRDDGATWQALSKRVLCPDAAWLCQAYPAVGLAVGTLQFDPVARDRLWVSAGTSPWYATVQAETSTLVWVSRVTGIEQLVANTVVVPPGGKPVTASWDFGLHRIEDPERYPRDYAPTPHEFGAAWHVDWASSDPNTLVAFLCWARASQSSVSRDRGVTWRFFPRMPVGNDCDDTWGWGGTGAAATPTSWIWVPSRKRAPYFTRDGGQTWQKLALPGVRDDVSDAGWGSLHFDYYLNRHIVAADRVNIGTYYLYHPVHGVFRSSDFASTWTLVRSGALMPFSVFNAKLQSVPGRAGHLFFTSGQQGTPRDTNPSTAAPFLHSRDGGATWAEIPRVSEVYAFGFGKAEQSYPTLFIAGWYGGMYGIWKSTDEGASWKPLGPEYALDSLDTVKTIDGDKDRTGVVYLGFAGSGYAYYAEPAAPSGGIAPPVLINE